MNIVIIIFSFLSLIHFIFKNYLIDQNGEIDVTKQTGFTTLRFAIFAGLLIFIMNIITVGNKCSENKANVGIQRGHVRLLRCGQLWNSQQQRGQAYSS